jgi:hypothetical protein
MHARKPVHMGPEHKCNGDHLVTKTKEIRVAIITLLCEQSLDEELVLQILEAGKDLGVEQAWLDAWVPDIEEAENKERWQS